MCMSHSTLKHLLIILTILVCTLSSTPASAVTNGTEWHRYTSYDNVPVRIMDGENITWFLVRQNMYNNVTMNATKKWPSGSLLFYDRKNPAAGIQDVHSRLDLSGSEIEAANFNPRTEDLVVIYSTGIIDIFDKNGFRTTLDVLTRESLARARVFRTINFDLYDDIWISTKAGFLYIDGRSKEIRENAFFLKDVTDVCRVGKKVVAIIDGNFYQADVSSKLCVIDNFTPFTVMRNGPKCILPLSETSFAYIGNAYSGSDYASICRAWLDKGKWLSAVATDDSNRFFLAGGNSVTTTPLQSNALINKNGYLVFSRTMAYQLNYEKEPRPTLDFVKKTIGWLSAGDNYRQCLGSWDFENFWVARERYDFACRRSGDNGIWADNFIARYEGPMAHRYVEFAYSPAHGMVMVNQGANFDNDNKAVIQPMQMTLYRNGKWTDLSTYSNPPAFINDNAERKAMYEKNILRYPTPDPLGLHLDPDFPDYAVMGSIFDGITFMNMTDPAGTHLMFGSAENPKSTLPGFNVIAPDVPQWKGYCPMYPGGFDSEGTFWAYYMDVYSVLGEKSGPKLMYWSKAARKNKFENPEAASSDGWSYITIPFQDGGTAFGQCLALKHEKNKNKIVIYTVTSEWPIIILDHKGTLEDTTDDVVTVYYGWSESGNSSTKWAAIFDITEDPVNGNIIVSGQRACVEFPADNNPDSDVAHVSLLGTYDNKGHLNPIVPRGQVNTVIFDEYNRAWIGTQSDGILGLSADRKNIIAHYTTKNSPLPHDRVIHLGWNPEDKTLWISTHDGIASVRPDAPSEAGADETEPMAVPSVVDKDYSGVVTIYNIPLTSSLQVLDADGNVVNTPDFSTDRITYWDLKNSNGDFVPTGRYTIRDISGIVKDLEITVTR